MSNFDYQQQQDIRPLLPFLLGPVNGFDPFSVSASPMLCPALSKYLIRLDEIKFDGTVFQLNEPLEVTLYRQDDVWYCERGDLSILAFGDTAEQAAHSFCEDFAVLWEEIAQAPDDSLTPDAQEVKASFMSIVKLSRRG